MPLLKSQSYQVWNCVWGVCTQGLRKMKTIDADGGTKGLVLHSTTLELHDIGSLDQGATASRDLQNPSPHH